MGFSHSSSCPGVPVPAVARPCGLRVCCEVSLPGGGSGQQARGVGAKVLTAPLGLCLLGWWWAGSDRLPAGTAAAKPVGHRGSSPLSLSYPRWGLGCGAHPTVIFFKGCLSWEHCGHCGPRQGPSSFEPSLQLRAGELRGSPVPHTPITGCVWVCLAPEISPEFWLEQRRLES